MGYHGNSLHAFALENIHHVQKDDDISQIIINSLNSMNETLVDNDIITIATKIICRSEATKIDFNTIEASEEAIDIANKSNRHPGFIQLMLNETEILGYNKQVVLTKFKDSGLVLANGGADRNDCIENKNVPLKDGVPLRGDSLTHAWMIPKDPNNTAKQIRINLEEHYKVKIGIIILDSNARPWRIGTVGYCVGTSGVKTVDWGKETIERCRDYDGCYWPNAFTVGLGDELASLGNILMGEYADGTPVVVIRGLKNILHDRHTALTLNRPGTTPWEEYPISQLETLE